VAGKGRLIATVYRVAPCHPAYSGLAFEVTDNCMCGRENECFCRILVRGHGISGD
jgi:hypothetical protein